LSRLRAGFAALPWAVALRAGVLAGAALTLAQPYFTRAGLVALGLGVLGGSALADLHERWLPAGSRLRPRAIAAIAGIAALAVGGLALWMRGEPSAARALGAIGGALAVEIAGGLALALPGAFALRALARRSSLAALGEVALAGTAFAAAFAVHRGGMQHRPLGLGDFAWSRGADPALLFLLLGALGTLGLALLFLLDRRPRRPLFQVSALGLLLALLLGGIVSVGLPLPETNAGLGLAGEGREDPNSDRDGEDTQRDPREGQRGGSPPPPSRSLDDLSFRDDYSGGRSNSPVAVVVLHDDLRPPTGVFYFRQAAFSEFDGRRLIQSPRDDLDRDVARFFPTRPTPVDAPIFGRESRRKIDISVGLLVDHVRPFALDTPVLFEPAPRGTALRFQRAYRAQSLVLELPIEALIGAALPGPGGAEPPDLEVYRRGPEDPRYADLGREIAAPLLPIYRKDPVALALAVKDYLESEGTYSLKSQHASAADPTASFLFGDRVGYCVHFAHAAAFLLRALGVPTRVATGYAISEQDRGSGSSLMLRGMNAHAWAEVFLPSAGWMVVDAWPRQSQTPNPPPPDPELQRMLGELLREQLSDRPPEVWQDPPLSLGELARLALLALAALAAAGFAVRALRRGIAAIAPRASRERLRFVSVLDSLAEVGLVRRFGETRERFAARVAARAPSFSRLTGLRLARNLGAAVPGDPRQSLALTRAVRRELRASVPLWRRWLGRAHPFIWWRVR
jgi:transglutaminase-like putative cysteine protease